MTFARRICVGLQAMESRTLSQNDTRIPQNVVWRTKNVL